MSYVTSRFEPVAKAELNSLGLIGIRNSFKLNMILDTRENLFENAHLDSIPPREDYLTRRLNRAVFVEISFGKSRYQRVVRGVRATDSEKIAIIGGTLGLFTGISFISLIEIVFWVVRAVNVKVYEWGRKRGESEEGNNLVKQ